VNKSRSELELDSVYWSWSLTKMTMSGREAVNQKKVDLFCKSKEIKQKEDRDQLVFLAFQLPGGVPEEGKHNGLVARAFALDSVLSCSTLLISL